MSKLIYFIFLFCAFLFTSSVNAQYKLRPAFPNLPAFIHPIEFLQAEDGTNRLFVAQQRGLVYVFNNSPTVSTRKTFINLTSKVTQDLGEVGLLGLAFHPNYENNRYFYVNYVFDSTGSGSGYWSRISRFTASLSNPDTALLNTELILMTLSQPYSNHNGGKVAFGQDGYLYISFGDGGNGGDPHGNGQSKTTLLGKILRINVDSASGGRNYAIPVTNPFYGNTSGYREEIYAYGLRNVWKFSFDFPTNRLYAGDVGQGQYEEIDVIENGKNYGWNKMEGFHCYGTCDTTGYGFIRPIWEYAHTGGQWSVTGGNVYRGALLPGLAGKYLYADYAQGVLWALTYDGINPATNVLLQDTTLLLSAFGTDQNNELYVCKYSGTTGAILKIVNTAMITLDLKAAIQGLYDNSINQLSLKDTMRVFVRSINSPYTIIDSAKTIIDSLTLKGLCFFNVAPTGKYYIVLKHRNTLETWSRAGGDSLIRGSVTVYDFTNDSTKAYGSNEIKKGSIYCLYSGDINQDEIIDGSDASMVDNDAASILTGFLVTDLNGDGIVDGSDLLIVSNNAGNLISIRRP